LFTLFAQVLQVVAGHGRGMEWLKGDSNPRCQNVYWGNNGSLIDIPNRLLSFIQVKIFGVGFLLV
jgi:hypothetical protein